jgi:hypothetical protein
MAGRQRLQWVAYADRTQRKSASLKTIRWSKHPDRADLTMDGPRGPWKLPETNESCTIVLSAERGPPRRSCNEVAHAAAISEKVRLAAEIGSVRYVAVLIVGSGTDLEAAVRSWFWCSTFWQSCFCWWRRYRRRCNGLSCRGKLGVLGPTGIAEADLTVFASQADVRLAVDLRVDKT